MESIRRSLPIFENLDFSDISTDAFEILSSRSKSTLYSNENTVLKILNKHSSTKSINEYQDYEFENSVLLEGCIMEALSSLNCPHFPKFISLNRIDTEAILLMEKIRGETLTDSRLTDDEKEVVIFQVCYALYLASQYKFVHGDLIGSNILIERIEREVKEYNIEGIIFIIDNQGINIKLIDFEFSRIEVFNSYVFNSKMMTYHQTKYAPPYSVCIDVCKLLGNPRLKTSLDCSELMKDNHFNRSYFVIEPYQSFSILSVFSSNLFRKFRINDTILNTHYIEDLSIGTDPIRDLYKRLNMSPLEFDLWKLRRVDNSIKFQNKLNEVAKIQIEDENKRSTNLTGYNPILNIKINVNEWILDRDNIIFQNNDNVFCLKRSYFTNITDDHIVNLVVSEDCQIQYIKTLNSEKYLNLTKYGMSGIVKLSTLKNALNSGEQIFILDDHDVNMDCLSLLYLKNQLKSYGFSKLGSYGFKNHDSLNKYTHKWDSAINHFIRFGTLSGKTLANLDFYGNPNFSVEDADFNIRKCINDIDDEFKKAAKIEHGVVLFRGIKHPFIEGINPCFVSASLNPTVAKDFSGGFDCYLYIENGIPYLPLMTVSHHSEEEEILLPRNLKYTIFHIERVDSRVKYHISVQKQFNNQFKDQIEYRSYRVLEIKDFNVDDVVHDDVCKMNTVIDGKLIDPLKFDEIDHDNKIVSNGYCYNLESFREYINGEYEKLFSSNDDEAIRDPMTRRVIEQEILSMFQNPCLRFNGSDLAEIAGKLPELTTLHIRSIMRNTTLLSLCTKLKRLIIEDTRIEDISVLSSCVNLEYLKLSNLHITNITPLSSCVNLKILNLSDNSITEVTPLGSLVNLEDLNLEGNPITDISPLESCLNLFHLNLSSTNVFSIESLRYCTKLKSLSLSTTEISNIEPLSSHICLEKLALNNTKVTDLEPIRVCVNLETLTLTSTGISDITPLSSCTKLENLFLSINKISNIDSLSGLINLTKLCLNDTRITDITPLSNLVKLNYLNLSKTKISDITPLSRCINLDDLDLSKTKILDITPLSRCTKIKELDLSITKISDISCLSSFVNLEILALVNTQVLNIWPLSQCLKLRMLFLESTGVDSIESLSSCFNLEELSLKNTKVTNINPLFPCKNLQYLYLEDTNVSNIEVISLFMKLTTLDLKRSLVEDLSPICNCTNLTELCISGTSVVDISPLSYCLSLERLYLNYTRINNIQALSVCKNLTVLDLRNSLVRDISPVSRIPKINIVV